MRLLLPPRPIVFALAVVGIGVSAISAVGGIFSTVGDGYMAKAFLKRGQERREVLAQAQSFYGKAARLEPWQPSHHFKRGQAFELEAESLSSFGGETQTGWGAAAASYRIAARQHPANARLQANLAWSLLQSGDFAAGRFAAQAAYKLAPEYQDVRFLLARWYLVQWESLSIEDQRFATTLVHRGVQERIKLYLDTVWQLLPNAKSVRQILPENPRIRRYLLDNLTERGLFSDRWAEQAEHDYLRGPLQGVRVLGQSVLTGRMDPPQEAVVAGAWSGLPAGWLSAGVTATLKIQLPPGEVVLYVPLLGEAAGGVWPAVDITLNGNSLQLPPISKPGWRIVSVLVSSPGGEMPLQAVVTNGTVVQQEGRFTERRAALGPVRILTPERSVRAMDKRKAE